MALTKCRWTLAPAEPLLVNELASALHLPPLLVRCLLNRGLKDPGQIAAFLEPRLKGLGDPFQLPHMREAVDRLVVAHRRGEKVVIFGDYDVDGVTSTSLLVETLRRLDWQVDSYLPHRFDEGYGLSQEAVENCLNKTPATLLLAVDCGSTAHQPIAWLRSRGVDTIVLDHHQCSPPFPDACALVNPQAHLEAGSGSRGLCSVGLAFKLAHALVKEGRRIGLPKAVDFDLRPLLDLVALGTIADLVPLTGENRILVSSGLERLRTTTRPGLRALKEVAGTRAALGVVEVAFQLGPRLNAAGRMENALDALHLLLAEEESEAMKLAQALDARNRERQQVERSMAEQVLRDLRGRFNPETDYVVVEGQSCWHLGVVGIVASRVLREYYRPTIILGGDGDQWRGSGRSIDGFDLAAALRACDGLLTRHGGHAMAAGLSLPTSNLEPLRVRLNELARQALRPEHLRPVLPVDAEVDLKELTLETMQGLNQLEPHGQGNGPVRLVARGVAHTRPPQRLGKENRHLKMWVGDGATVREALWWNCPESAQPTGRFDLAFAPEINEFRDVRSVQLRVLDWRPADP